MGTHSFASPAARRLGAGGALALVVLGTASWSGVGPVGATQATPPAATGVLAASTATPMATPIATPIATPTASPLTPPIETPIPVAALQARLDSIRTRNHVPGVSVTMIWPDGRSWTGTSGWANVGSGIPVVVGTAFSIGSVSKTFLAALVLQLAQEGRLALDDPVVQWLPTAPVVGTVTIRELLDHTSGVYDFFENAKIDPALLAHPRSVWTPARSLSFLRAPYCQPATCWAYSNSNYVILGQLVQRLTGHTVAGELRRRLFDPLTLRRTFVQGAEARRGTVATSYELTGWGVNTRAVSLADGTPISPFTSVVTAAGSAGAIAASSRDLAVFTRRLFAGSVLQPIWLAAMLDISQSQSVGAPIDYGLGVAQATFGGRLTYGHNGRLLGARASIRYLPESGFTIAVVTNQDRLGPDVIGTSLLNVVIPPPVVVPPPVMAPATPTPSPSPMVPMP